MLKLYTNYLFFHKQIKRHNNTSELNEPRSEDEKIEIILARLILKRVCVGMAAKAIEPSKTKLSSVIPILDFIFNNGFDG